MSSRKPFYQLTRQGKRKRLKRMTSEMYDIDDEMPGNPEPSTSVQEDLKYSDQTPTVENATSDLVQSGDSVSSTLCGLSNQSKNSATSEDSVVDILDTWEIEDSSSDKSDDDEEFVNSERECERLQKELQNWSARNSVSAVALSALLCILKTHTCFKKLPSDARTVKKTPTSVQLQPLDPGQYSHIGIAFGLRKIWDKVIENIQSIELLVGIDGLPIFSSSSSELWPILGSVINIQSLQSFVFPIGIYYGKQKPMSSKAFLTPFVEEIVFLIQNGIELNGKKVSVILKGICCDAPAKAFVLGVKGHAGYSSCTRCKQRGLWINKRMTFPKKGCEPRTHEGFLRKEDREYHNCDSALTCIPGFNLVSSLPLDYMHLVCLGVMRTILAMWVFGKPPLKFQSSIIDAISSRLLSLHRYIPYEICRRPRGLNELKRWKATEFRQFLIYTGPLVLTLVFLPHHKKIYNLFITLHIAITILLNPSLIHQYGDYAKLMLYNFVDAFQAIYGGQFLTHNFHGLTHIVDDTATFGPLDLCSAFKFENFLFTLKKLLKKGDKPLQQILKRVYEMLESDIKFHPSSKSNMSPHCRLPEYKQPHGLGPILDGCSPFKQFRRAQFPHFKLSNLEPNNCCRLDDGSIVLIENFVFSDVLNRMVIICKQFDTLVDLYSDPFCPSSELNIFKVSDLSENLKLREVSSIANKMVFLSLDNLSVVLPLLHSE